jgi:carbon-monoxide dehydrogenase medium subunit
MRDFEFLEPRTVREASAMLATHGEDARVMAGGTALVLAMRQRLLNPSHLVWLGGVPGLNAIDVDGGGTLRIGALALHHDIETHPVVRARFPVLSTMAARVANAQIRNAATVGGNLCHGDPASDPPACLLALDARVRAVTKGEEREIRLEDFFTGYYENALRPHEIVTEVRVPPLADDATAVYMRFTTTAAESRPLVAVGAVVKQDGQRTCRAARLVVGAVSATPTRLRGVEDFVTGRRLDADTLARVGELAAEAVKPLDDFRASADYRAHVTGVMVRRALERAVAEAI